MAISTLDSNFSNSSLLSRLREQGLSPADLVSQQTDARSLQSLSPEQLAEARATRSGLLTDIQGIQSFPCPPLPPPISPETPPVDPQQLLRQQDPEAYTAYTRLPPDDQRAFLDLCRTMMETRPPGIGGFLGQALGGLSKREPASPGQAATPRIDTSLLNLLKSGKLSSRDSTGRTLLQNLTGLAGQEMGPNLDRASVLRELCSQIDDPGRITQGSRNTCGPGTIEHLQATRDPAEYARIVAGLTSREGTVQMRNGDTLSRDRGSVGPDDSGRTSISRLYQAALMEYSNGDNEYDNRTDQHTRGDDSTYTGLFANEFERSVDALFGDKYDFQAVNRSDAESRAGAEQQIREAINRGEQVPVLIEWDEVGGEWSGHYLSVVGMTDSTVVLRNPWGGREQGGSNGPDRTVLDGGGTIEMSKAEFFQRLVQMALPKDESRANSLSGSGVRGVSERGPADNTRLRESLRQLKGGET